MWNTIHRDPLSESSSSIVATGNYRLVVERRSHIQGLREDDTHVHMHGQSCSHLELRRTRCQARCLWAGVAVWNAQQVSMASVCSGWQLQLFVNIDVQVHTWLEFLMSTR